MKDKKTVKPTQHPVILGVQYDLVKKTVKVSEKRVPRLVKLIDEFLKKNFLDLKEIQQLIGKLNFACDTIRGLRVELRLFIMIMVCIYKRRKSFRLRNTWQVAYVRSLIRVKKLIHANVGQPMTDFVTVQNSPKPDFLICSYASSHFGMMGYLMMRERCFFYKTAFETLPFEIRTLVGFLPTVTDKYININTVECLLTLILVFHFADKLKNSKIEIRTDSNTVFCGLKKQTIKAHEMVPMLQILLNTLYKNNISFDIKLFKSEENDFADKLSRNEYVDFD